MTQHTQPVVAAQHQQQTLTTQHQQQQQTTTTPNSNNNNNQSNNNNVSSASTTTTAPSTSNNQTQTVAVQQQQQQQHQNNNNNNNYQTQQNVSGPVYNPQLQPANVFVPAHNIPAHHHAQHHQPGAMYQTMIPAALPSNVYVNNVTANVNLHGWTHTVPHSAWVHPGSAQHYIHGELPPEQGAPLMQPMTAMPVTLPNPNALTGPLMNHNVNAISGGSRGSRRGRGRVGSSGSRRSDYNAAQRHPPPEGSPVPQSTGQTGQQDLQQQQQSSDSQQMLTAVPQSYVPHPQYAAQYPYSYPAFFAPPQHMLHPGQSAAAQQATGTPLYFPTMPVYNGHQMVNYGYFPVLNQAEYQYVPGEEVGVGVPVGDERQAGSEAGAMMWHPQPIYTDEYGNMSSADMHAIPSDDINHTSSSMGSAADTPNLLSPNYAPIYDPQMQEQLTQQMGVMQIYDDPHQMGQIQVMHPQSSGVSQMEDELSECGSQPSSQIQMVAPIQLVPSSATEQIMHHQAPHLIPATGAGAAAIMSTESNIASNATPIQQHQIQQQQSLTEDNTIDNSGHVQTYENVTANIQQRESITSSNNEELVQKPAENLAQQDYHKQQQHQQQQQQIQIQTQNVVVEAVQTDNYNSNRTIITEVQEVVVQEHKPLTKTDVAIETVLASSQTNIGKPQQQQQQQQTVYTHQPPEKQQKHQQHHQQQQYGAKQHQQQEYQHQQLQTQSVAPQQQATNQHQAPQQQQGGHYQQHQPQHQQQQQHHQQTSYENRKSSQMYNQQHQSRRKYDYHHGHSSTGSNSSNNDSSSNTQQHHQQQQTTKTMSWTNSSQHKKSTNTVAVTATPTSSHTGAGSYNKSSSGATNSASTHTHTTRTYTNQQHHNYQQQQQQNQQQQQQQQNYHYQQQQQHQPQTRNYGAMKMPSSPIASVTNPMERKTSQTSDAGGKSHAQQQQQQQQTTSTASTTAVPHQFQQQQQQQPLQHQQSQQTSTTDVVVQHTQSSLSSSSSIVANTTATAVPANTTTNISKSQQQQQYPPGFANKKHSLSNQGHTTSGNTANAANTTETATTATTPAINLAPPVTATTPAVPSTQSWASLFSSTSNSNNSTTASANTSANILSSNASTASYTKKPVAKVAPYEVLAPVTPTAPLVTPGALSYSAASAQNLPPPSTNSSSTSSATAAKKASSSSSGDQTLSQRNSMANLDEFSLKFAEFLTKYKSDWATISLRPRGLTNRSNYCYINSILQALLGCSPLYNLIRSIPKQAANLCEVKTPTVNAMITFMSNFSNLPSGLRLRNPKGSKNNKDDLGSDLQCDPAFEPTEIYKLWNDSREEHVEGRQEDAEEFLSYILNKLNDEMLEVIKLIAKPKPEQNGQNEPPEEEGDAWQMICNNRNKGSVTRQTDFGCTPLSDIFRGELRSRLQREGELSTDVIQPFFTLQLNIEKAASVKEALEILVGRDQLEGVTGSKSKQEVVAWQQMNLEKLPPILILHLKWFDYRSDGCTKILKKVDFPVELKIDAKILASKKYSQKQRAYRLFAVVYHDGKEATKGHYITDVYHTGYGSWLRYDDSSVKPVSENHVLLPRAPRVPYLLCYRRCDTIPQQSNNNQNSSGGNNNNNNSSGNATQSSGK